MWRSLPTRSTPKSRPPSPEFLRPFWFLRTKPSRSAPRWLPSATAREALQRPRPRPLRRHRPRKRHPRRLRQRLRPHLLHRPNRHPFHRPPPPMFLPHPRQRSSRQRRHRLQRHRLPLRPFLPHPLRQHRSIRHRLHQLQLRQPQLRRLHHRRAPRRPPQTARPTQDTSPRLFANSRTRAVSTSQPSAAPVSAGESASRM